MSRIVVIAGAGPAGLTAALELQRHTDCRPLVFEADTQVGGISKTVVYRGNRMDLGGHRFFSKSDWVMNWWQEILPLDPAVDPAADVRLAYQGQARALPAAAPSTNRDKVMLLRSRLSRIYYRRRFFEYPLTLNLQTIGNLGWLETGLIGTSYLRSKLQPVRPETTLEDFFVNRFGRRLYGTFFRDYTEKVWGVPCAEISADWGAQRVKGLSVTRALLHALGSALRTRRDLDQKNLETSLIERFLYPRLGPGQMWEEVASRVQAGGGEIHLRHRVVGLRRRAWRVEAVEVLDLDAGTARWIECDHFVSTMAVNTLVDQLHPESSIVADLARGLPHRDFMTAGLVVRKMSPAAGRSAGRSAGETTVPDNWIYVQEPDVRLGRVQVFNNWSPDLVADPSTVSLGLEYFCQEGDDTWTMADDRFLSFAAKELAHIGLIDEHDVLDGTVVRVPKAYPAYFGSYPRMDEVREYLDQFENVYAVGRNGMHRYNNQDHSMLAARAAVDCIAGTSGDRSAIWAVNAEDDYHEART